MTKSLKVVTSITLNIMLLLCLAAVLSPVKAQAQTKLYIDPAENLFYANVTFLMDKFKVYVKIADVTNMYAYEFKLRFNNDTIKLLSAVRPPGHFMEPVDPGNQFIPVWKLNAGGGPTWQFCHLGFTLLAPEAPKTGSGVLVELTFQIIKEPPEKGSVSSPLDLYDTKLADDKAAAIPHIAVDGRYEYFWVPPPPPPYMPYLSVEPDIKRFPPGAPIVGTAAAKFDVEVWINDAHRGWWLVGIEFKLAYNSTLIKFLGMEVAPWVEQFGNIYLVPVVEGTTPEGLAYLHTAVLLLPHEYPPATWYKPIEGSGPLVKISFEVIYQDPFPWVGESPLDLYDVLFSNNKAEPVPARLPHEDGKVSISGYVIGRAVDVYTQYPAPYGGQGPNQPSDMFWPQKEVELYANVTYNLWPVQQKMVAFEIRDPSGKVVTVLTAISDKYGVAHTTFRIPWPCEDPESLFGVWTVTATVDIACIVVNDTLQFHFDYLVRWAQVKTDKTSYAHCEDVKVTVEYKSYSIQQRPVLLTVVIHDELNYPIGWAYINTTVGDLDMGKWCTYAYYVGNVTIHIPKHAAAGVATIYVNAFSAWPSAGGSPWTPQKLAKIEIRPEWKK